MEFLFFVITVCIVCYFLLANKVYFTGNPRAREARIVKLSKLRGFTYKPFFSKPIQSALELDCFEDKTNVSFINVRQDNDEDGFLYVGELLWLSSSMRSGHVVEKRGLFTRQREYIPDSSGPLMDVKNYLTMAVIQNDSFKLPLFFMKDETFILKAQEKVKLNSTTDIDFADDKEFSEAWWLAGQFQQKVRALFNKKVRAAFMGLAKKGFQIYSKNNYLYFVANKIYQPDDYDSIIREIKKVHRAIRENDLYYKPQKEEAEVAESN